MAQEEAPEPDASSAPGDATATSVWRRFLVAAALTALAVLIGSVAVHLGVRRGGLYGLVGGVLLTQLGLFLAGTLFLEAADPAAAVRLVRGPLPERSEASLPLAVGTALPATEWRLLVPIVGWSAALVAFAAATTALAGALGVPVEPATGQETAPGSVTALALLLALNVFVVAPVEEGFFRGVVQTSLREATTGRGAVLGASVLFALAHGPQHLLGPGGGWTAIAVVFVVGLAIGTAYEVSGSLPVAIGIHACYNCLLLLGVALLA